SFVTDEVFSFVRQLANESFRSPHSFPMEFDLRRHGRCGDDRLASFLKERSARRPMRSFGNGSRDRNAAVFFVADAARTQRANTPVAVRDYRSACPGVVVFRAASTAIRWARYHLDSMVASFGNVAFFRRRFGLSLAAGEFRFLAV